MDPHPDPHQWLTLFRELLIELLQARLDFLRRFNGRLRFSLGVVFERYAEHSQHSISSEFVHHAPPVGNGWHANFHAPVEPVHQLPRAQPFRHAGEIGGVGEQNRDRQLSTFKTTIREKLIPLIPELLSHRR